MFQFSGLPYVLKVVPNYIDLNGEMKAKINQWFGYYLTSSEFYNHEGENTGALSKTVTEKWKRETLHPAQMVSQEMANLIFNEDTQYHVEAIVDKQGNVNSAKESVRKADDWLQSWAKLNDYQTICNESTEWACSLGTSAQLLHFSKVNENTGLVDPESDVNVVRYDARYIFPIAYTKDSITDVCFVQLINMKNKWAVEVSRVKKDSNPDGTIIWKIKNRWFKFGGGEFVLSGDEKKRAEQIENIEEISESDFVDEIIIPCEYPPFALLRPAIENIYAVNSCMGVSVYDGAISAIRLCDLAMSNFINDIELGQKMVFIDEDMMQGDRENLTLPWDVGKRLFRKVFRGIGNDSKHIEEYNPSLRTAENEKALSTALTMLGMRTGFGATYWQFDKATHSVMTATAEVLDQQALIRTITRHENSFRRPIQQMLSCMLAAKGWNATVTLAYDDSVIIDTEHQREVDRAEVAMGLMPAYVYIMKWNGLDEAKAKAWVAENAQAVL